MAKCFACSWVTCPGCDVNATRLTPRLQVTGLADEFAKVRNKLTAPDRAQTGSNAPEAKDGAPSSSARNAHILEGHRQTMAGVVPRLYQLLSNAVETNAEGERGQDNEFLAAARQGRIESIKEVLHGTPWLWVGDAFVPADQARK